MSSRTAAALAIIIGLLAISATTLSAAYLAWSADRSQRLDFAALIARDVLRRSVGSTTQVLEVLGELRDAGATDPCSDENRRLMGAIDLRSEQIQTVGYIRDDTLRCSAYALHQTPVGPPDYSTPYGTEVRIGVTFPILPDRRFLVVTDKATGYTAAIHPDLPLDVFTDEADIAVGVFSTQSRTPIISRGVSRPQWLDRLGDQDAARFSDGAYIVAIQRAPAFALAAYAAVPARHGGPHFRRTVAVAALVGLLAGGALTSAILLLVRRQQALPALLRSALRRKALFLAYQPVVDLRTRRWVGAEALVRWRRDDGELMRTDLFVAAAEQAGLSRRLTAQVMGLLATDARGWFRRHPAFHISLNLSAADMESSETLAELRRLVGETGAGPRNLMVEVTERAFIRLDVARKVLGDIRAMGVQTAIDDFGTGYSSLSSLQTLELDCLKIDKSFVDTIGKDAATSHVVRHVIEMAKSLNLRIIAEGVETEEQAQYLAERGVDLAQGWLFARPMSFVELVQGLQAQEPQAAGPA